MDMELTYIYHSGFALSGDGFTVIMDYIHRLAKVNEQTKDKLIIIPRIYTNKPRTTGEGYKGIDGDPHKRWSMWFNSKQREKPYQVLTS